MNSEAKTKREPEPRGILCACGCAHFEVVYTRRIPGGAIRRRRECQYCGGGSQRGASQRLTEANERDFTSPTIDSVEAVARAVRGAQHHPHRRPSEFHIGQ